MFLALPKSTALIFDVTTDVQPENLKNYLTTKEKSNSF